MGVASGGSLVDPVPNTSIGESNADSEMQIADCHTPVSAKGEFECRSHTDG